MLLREEKYLQSGREIKTLLGERQLVLASSSPRRKQILTEIGIEPLIRFSVIEEHINSTPPDLHVKKYALEKAKAVSSQFAQGLILGADTIVVLDGRILGKPRDRGEAFHMLSLLSGRTHTVYSGVALINPNSQRQAADFQTTLVTFNSPSKQKIEEYLETGEYADKAGAYGIQGMGNFLVKQIQGDLDNVIGLPLATVKKLLQKVL
jgi:septum formation protein